MNKTIKTIFLTGYMGAGKTLIGKSLSKKIVLKEDCKKECRFLNISGTEFRKKIILKKPFKFARPELNKYLKNFKGKIFYND